MNKTGYLKTPIVHEFINYFSGLIEGKSINHQYEIRDTKLPDGYKEDHCEKDGSLKIDNLEDAFKKYWWKSKDYYQNKTKLDQLEKDIKDFHNKEDKDPDQCYELIKEVFKWGGVWHVNKRGVGKVENKDHLIKLEDAIKEMNSQNPDLDVFDKERSRMNAGYTKYYSLACKDVIIYDGRVGAALGLIARKFCEDSEEKNKDKVPPELNFRWGPARNSKVNRDPSESNYKFIKFNANDREHAESNIRANWIIVEALERTKRIKPDITWTSHKEIDIRMIEAALFTIGYSL